MGHWNPPKPHPSCPNPDYALLNCCALELHAGFARCDKAERETHTGLITGGLCFSWKTAVCLATEERHDGKRGLLLVGEAEGAGENVGHHTPDRDYAPGGSCHTCRPLHPGLCPSGRRCTRRGSCLSRSEYLKNYVVVQMDVNFKFKKRWEECKGWFSGYDHLRRCPRRRRRPRRCCPCPFGLGCYCKDSCRNGHPRRLCHNHTAWGCRQTDSCPVSRERGEKKS